MSLLDVPGESDYERLRRAAKGYEAEANNLMMIANDYEKQIDKAAREGLDEVKHFLSIRYSELRERVTELRVWAGNTHQQAAAVRDGRA